MDWIIENAFKLHKIKNEEDRKFIIENRCKIRDIGNYEHDLYSVGKSYYYLELENVDPNHCIRDNFGFEAIGRGVVEKENWIQLPSGAYIMEHCIFDCNNCPYGFKSEKECSDTFI